MTNDQHDEQQAAAEAAQAMEAMTLIALAAHGTRVHLAMSVPDADVAPALALVSPAAVPESVLARHRGQIVRWLRDLADGIENRDPGSDKNHGGYL